MTAVATIPEILNAEELRQMDAYWRACNYLCAGMIYLYDNPLLREPLKVEHIKQRLLGHWGSDPGQTFLWVHLNRLIRKYGLDMIYIAGPGHGAPAMLSNAWMEGTYSEIYPDKSQDLEGMRKFFREFSFPGGIGSHCTPETPGSIHEGGELGYSLSHAFGAAFDNPDLIVNCVVGDGEAETGPLATSWHSNKFLNPVRDGAVLPILHLNGYKIANPTILARIPHEELEWLLRGYGWDPHFVEGDDPPLMHQTMATMLEHCIDHIRAIQREAREHGKLTGGNAGWPRWPMIVLRIAQRLDLPEGSRRPQARRLLARAPGPHPRNPRESRAPEAAGKLAAQLSPRRIVRRERPAHRRAARSRSRRHTPHERESARQRWLLRKPLHMPDFRDYAFPVKQPGARIRRPDGNSGAIPARCHAQ